MADRSRKPFRPGHYQTPHAPADAERPKHAERDRYDWITLWTAIIGVALVSVGTGVAAYQAVVMRQELDSALRQQRAWIKVAASPKSGLILWPDRAEMPLNLTISNVGSVPATYVKVSTRLVPAPALKPGEKGPSVPPSHFAICERGGAGEWGYTAFPGETVEVFFDVPAAPPAEMARVVTDDREVGFVALICAAYQSGSEREIHRTVAAFALSDPRGNLHWRLDPTEIRAVPAGDLRLAPLGLLNRAD